jgi:hypothetical protein
MVDKRPVYSLKFFAEPATLPSINHKYFQSFMTADPTEHDQPTDYEKEPQEVSLGNTIELQIPVLKKSHNNSKGFRFTVETGIEPFRVYETSLVKNSKYSHMSSIVFRVTEPGQHAVTAVRDGTHVFTYNVK